VNIGYRDDHNKYGPLSLDVPFYEDGTRTLGEKITRGLWQ
jgi:hypothetical protein